MGRLVEENDTYTPLFDSLVARYGVITASVYGRIWRYCQMVDMVCKASEETLAEELNLSRATIIRSKRNLVIDGFLMDLTPDLRNRPHILKTTDKLMTVAKWKQVADTVAESNSAESGSGAESNSTVAESNSGCVNLQQPTVAESLKSESSLSNKDTDKDKGNPSRNGLPDPKKTWQWLSADLQRIIGNPVTYQQKVAACSLIGWENLELCIQAPDSHTRDWLIGRAAREVNRRLETILPGATVRFTARPVDGQRQAL